MPNDSTQPRPVLVCLHYLGGSTREWGGVARALAGSFRVLAVDLPGFGAAATVSGDSVAALADHVAGVVRQAAPGRWVLVGHSMGAKVAAVLARRSEDGEAGLGGLERLVLLAGSPPGPEPMAEARRQAMRGWFAGDPASSRAEAEAFVGANVGAPLPPKLHDQAAADVLRCRRGAWVAWLDGGSKEDWADRIGVLQTPALLVSGADDADLGPEAQRRLVAPHFARAGRAVLQGAKHLLPLERPGPVAALILNGAAA